MAWIESHQGLARHPKTLRLAASLGIELPTAIGYLQMLWWWAMDYAQDGELDRFLPLDIAAGCSWDGSPDVFVGALMFSGFIDHEPGCDKPLRIHDWPDYAGRLIERREANAERQRSFRERRNALRNDDKRARNDATVPNRTQPDQTKPTVPETPPVAPQGADKPAKKAQKVFAWTTWDEIPEPSRLDLLAYAKEWFSPEDVPERVNAGLNHTSRKKWLDTMLGLKGWLRRDHEWSANHGSTARTAGGNGRVRDTRNSHEVRHVEPGSRGPGAFANYG